MVENDSYHVSFTNHPVAPLTLQHGKARALSIEQELNDIVKANKVKLETNRAVATEVGWCISSHPRCDPGVRAHTSYIYIYNLSRSSLWGGGGVVVRDDVTLRGFEQCPYRGAFDWSTTDDRDAHRD